MAAQKRFVSTLLAGLMTTVMITGCGSGDQPAAANTGATNKAAATKTASSATANETIKSAAGVVLAADAAEDTAAKQTVTRPDGWNEASHSNAADPNYDVVFPRDRINQITITIAADDYAAMQANMTDLFGAAGTGGGAPGGEGAGMPGAAPGAAGGRPPGQPPARGGDGAGGQPPAGAMQPPAESGVEAASQVGWAATRT